MSETLSAKDAAKVAEDRARAAIAECERCLGECIGGFSSVRQAAEAAASFTTMIEAVRAAAKAGEREELQEREQVYREALERITRLLSDDNATARIIARAALAQAEQGELK